MMCDLHMQYAMAADSPVGSDDPTTVIVSFVSFIHVQDGWGGSDWHLLVLVNIWGLFLLRERVELLVPNHSSWGYHYHCRTCIRKLRLPVSSFPSPQPSSLSKKNANCDIKLYVRLSIPYQPSFKVAVLVYSFYLLKELPWYRDIAIRGISYN